MKPRDLLALITLSAIWGASYPFIKVALEAYSPAFIVATRLVLGAGILTAVLFVRGVSMPRDLRTWKLLAFMAVVANVVPFALITWGEEHVTAALTSILNSTTPIFTAVFASLFLPQETMNLMRAMGVALGFAGVVVIVGFDGGGELLAELAIVLAALAYGVGFTFSKRFLSGTERSPLAMSAVQLLIASVVTVPVAVGAGAPELSFPVGPAVSVLCLGVFGTGFAYLIYYRLIREVGATTASFVTYLIPVWGVLLGWLVLGERLGWNALVGGAIVVAGMALAERGARRAAAVAAPARA